MMSDSALFSDGSARDAGVLTRVVVVGLGQAGGFIIEALDCLPSVELVAGVEPKGRDSSARLGDRPVYPSLGELPPSLDPDVIVIATPTESHVPVGVEILDRVPRPRLILCEKPLATQYSEALSLFRKAAKAGVRLRVLYHFAYSPEVMWASAQWPVIQESHGPVSRFTSQFDDPKRDLAIASEALVSSWADAGINAMSVLARFVTLDEISQASAGGPARCSAT
ncbi:MAG: Gfo/Idh/MocA family oxidoreductase, partial [Actinomycetota bacterium]|nr:Gfo/Idh/MocA family oxidoreductase [Actinomycetota bacterium]